MGFCDSYGIMAADNLCESSLNFLWPDHNQRLVSLAAPTYIDFVMSWLQKLLEDENVFPTKSGKSLRPWLKT